MGSLKNVLLRERDPSPAFNGEGPVPTRLIGLPEDNNHLDSHTQRIEMVVEGIVSSRMDKGVRRGENKKELFYYEELVSEAQTCKFLRERPLDSDCPLLTLSSEEFLLWWNQEKERIITQRSE